LIERKRTQHAVAVADSVAILAAKLRQWMLPQHLTADSPSQQRSAQSYATQRKLSAWCDGYVHERDMSGGTIQSQSQNCSTCSIVSAFLSNCKLQLLLFDVLLLVA
jgi:hypothetical protein